MSAPRISPLRPLINSSIVISSPGETVLSSARYTAPEGPRYLIKTYLQRQDGEGTDDGQIPSYGSRSSSGGGITSTWTFRGYLVSYAIISNTFKHGDDETGLEYFSILNDSSNGIAIPVYGGCQCTIRHGTLGYLHNGDITIVGGRYQGLGPDTVIYYELQGIPITVRGNFTH